MIKGLLGSGTSADPYLIETFQELNELSLEEGADKFYVKCKYGDIVWDMIKLNLEILEEDEKEGFNRIFWKFHSFDGNGLIIKNLYLTNIRGETADVSLPLITISSSEMRDNEGNIIPNEIKNLRFQNFSIGGEGFGSNNYFMTLDSSFDFHNVDFIGELQTNCFLCGPAQNFYKCIFSLSYKAINKHIGGTFIKLPQEPNCYCYFFGCTMNIQGKAAGGYGDLDDKRCKFYNCKFIGDYAYNGESGLMLRNSIMNCMFNENNQINVASAFGAVLNETKKKGSIEGSIASFTSEDFYNPIKLREENLTILGDTYEQSIV